MKVIHWIILLSLTAMAVFGALILYRKVNPAIKPLDNAGAREAIEAMTAKPRNIAANNIIAPVYATNPDPSIAYAGMGAKNNWN